MFVLNKLHILLQLRSDGELHKHVSVLQKWSFTSSFSLMIVVYYISKKIGHVLISYIAESVSLQVRSPI